MSRRIVAEPLTKAAFAPFGDVIETAGARHYPINGGRTERFHDLATAQALGPAARVILNIFCGQPYALPVSVPMVERHPLGSQAFVPLSPRPFLVVVSPDEGGRPGAPRAFLTAAGQGVNYPPGQWHGVLTPIGDAQDFLVVDRTGEGANLEEFFFPEPYEIVLAESPHHG